ncbi:acyl-CoA thioesterase [Streptomyces liangshanensis]|uniref:Acyl-CoA thioesterase n=1 Tax=Streptomyces liangshanensis TaxID=2717324 RepID=A0A6G9GTT8_9ACTN|nr:thioesterase family protein [Streptomyces liangshanensis]QIQ01357.1 acyl-CoA thioesterase [Streptomyces liangshanensis]
MARTVQDTALPKSEFGVLMPVNVFFDDFDPFGMLHNSRYQILVERAFVAFWRDVGIGGSTGLEKDAFNVVKAFTVIYDAPVTAYGEHAVHLWMERMGNTSATVGFRVCSIDGVTTYAHGSRTVVRLDSITLQPTPWSDRVREIARTIEGPQGRIE